jgi:GTP1/Obg family GTP-binding protein
MRLMHTSLPEFKGKLKKAAQDKEFILRGIENLKTAKMQSLRTGRIEKAVEELIEGLKAEKVEVVVMPRVPETMHTVVIKGYDSSGKPLKAVMEVINILHPTEDVELEGFETIDDRRPTLGRH